MPAAAKKMQRSRHFIMAKRKSKKAKIHLSVSSVILLTLIIAAVCALLLFLSILFPVFGSKKTEKDSGAVTVPAQNIVPDNKPEPAAPQENAGVQQEPRVLPEQQEKSDTEDRQVPGEQKITEKQKIPEEKIKEQEQEQEHEIQKREEKKVTEKPPEQISGKTAGKTIRPGAEKRPEVKPLFVIPDAVNGAVLAFVFDDAGQNLSQLNKVLALPFPLTVAVLPDLAYSVESARRIRSAGKEIILHQPMQSVNAAVSPGAGAITPDMRTYDIGKLIMKNLSEIGPVAGLNNHEGSLIMENKIQVGAVLDAASAAGIYFLDSRTTADTRAPQVALERGIAIYNRDIFLDNEKNKKNVLEEIKKGLAVANRKGYSIMIGHVWSADLIPPLLAELYPELVKKGYRFATVSGVPK